MLSLYEFDYDWHNNLIVEALRAFDSYSVPGLEGFYREQMDNDALDYMECSRFAIGYVNYGTSETLSIAQAYLEMHSENPELCVLAEFLYTHYRLRSLEGSIFESLGESIRAEEARIEERKNFFAGAGLLSLGKPRQSLPLVAPLDGTIVRDREKVGRNDPCLCGSGKKYKKCCL